MTVRPLDAEQLLKGGRARHGHEKIATTKPNTVFDLTFLPTGTRRTKVAFKQIMTAEGNKRPIFRSLSSFVHGQFDCGCQVIIANAPGDTAKVFECLHMAVQEASLPLGRKGHHKRFPREAQPQNEDLNRLPYAEKDGRGFTPIALGILARLKFKRKKDLWRLVCLLPLGTILTDTRL